MRTDIYEKVPNELKKYPNWVCFKYEPDPKRDKPKKVPINPKTDGRAMPNNPQTWGSYEAAINAVGRFDGLGFMFGGTPFMGIDLDHKETELYSYLKDGEENIISEFINTLQSYTELSPSGTGIHIICKGELPKDGRRNDDVGVEMYDDVRFFTVTGNSIGPYTDIRDCTEAVKPLHEKYIAKKPPAPAPTGRLTEHISGMPLTAEEVIEIAQKSKNGVKFSSLYNGDTSGYSSQSEADMAFCGMLAFWTGRNIDLMDCIYRRSGMMREKWDERRGNSTYGVETMQKAIASCANVFEPKPRTDYSVTIGEKPKQRLYTMDDMGNAQRFIDLFGDNVRYNYYSKKWLIWDNTRWKSDESGEIERMGDRAVEAMSAEAKFYEMQGEEDILKAFSKHIKSSRSNKSKTNMLKEVQHKLPITPDQLDEHPYAFNTPSGIVSLRTGELVPHDKKYFITHISGTKLENADCPLWKKFLNDVFMGDNALIRYVQKAVGYSLSGKISEQCIFILLGDGHNGKSTFLEVLRAVLGDYAANIQAESIMLKNGMSSSTNSDIARLNKKRFVTSSEPAEGARLNEGLIKQITGGEPVTARKLYENEQEFHPELKLWIGTNHKLIVRGTDLGIWRRLHVIPMNAQIPPEKEDKHFGEKLKKEYPAILKWAVDGCLLWQREGLGMPDAVSDSVAGYRREMDVVSGFIEECCEVGKELYDKASRLYCAYSEWCEKNNEYHMSSTKFGAELANRFTKVRREEGVFYIGVKLYS